MLLAQTIAFRRVLQQPAPPDALSTLCPALTANARAWLDRRRAARAAEVRRWLEQASTAAPGSPRVGGGGGWFVGWGGKRAAAPPRRQEGGASGSEAGLPGAGGAAAAAAAAAGGLSVPLLLGDEEVWGSGSDEFGSAASHLAGSSTRAGSFCTAVSQPADAEV